MSDDNPDHGKTWEDHVLDHVASWTSEQKNKYLQKMTGMPELELPFDEVEKLLDEKHKANEKRFREHDRNALKEVAAALKLRKLEM